MDIVLDKVSKRFNKDWLFKDLDYQFRNAQSYAITGPNGSGKTTLLKIISGMTPCTNGVIQYLINKKSLDSDIIYKQITYSAPYLEIPEELTLREFYKFHFHLKPALDALSINKIASRAGLEQALGKPLHTFSSGMKQRAKLAMSLFSSTPVLLLDEPTTNLDESGIAWYRDEIDGIKSKKLIILASNQRFEYEFCNHIMELDP